MRTYRFFDPPSEEPQYRGLDFVDPLLGHLEIGVEDAEEMLATLRGARNKPHVLDDVTLNRAIASHEESHYYCDIFAEQARRWSARKLPARTKHQVQRFARLVDRMRELCEAILDLTDELAEGTIDQVAQIPDEVLGLQVFQDKGPSMFAEGIELGLVDADGRPMGLEQFVALGDALAEACEAGELPGPPLGETPEAFADSIEDWLDQGRMLNSMLRSDGLPGSRELQEVLLRLSSARREMQL